MGQNGFSSLFILAGVFIVIFLTGGFLYFQNQASLKTTNTSPISSSQISTPKPETPPSNPTNNQTDEITVTKITQPPCTSSSCKSTTTLVIDGSNFTTSDKLTVTGLIDNSNSNGNLAQLNSGGSEVIFDIYNLSCQNYHAVINDPNSTLKPAGFLFKPTNCQ